MGLLGRDPDDGVDVEGEGTVTETTRDGLRCYVRWASHLDDPFVYKPPTGKGPRRPRVARVFAVRIKRIPPVIRVFAVRLKRRLTEV